MKLRHDPRHQKRREIVQMLFANSFNEQLNNVHQEVIEITKKRERIDKEILEAAPAWPIENINKIDLAILRLSVYELLEGNTPPKVVIDEAVELAKEFGAESSPSFVNGVLGTIFNKTQAEQHGQ
ncbi:MAG: transcription antitermination factor NusB [Patescibacteria group bacterium]|nr:transcription antitermination factor NusB [Patescibacteria group bacterium]